MRLRQEKPLYLIPRLACCGGGIGCWPVSVRQIVLARSWAQYTVSHLARGGPSQPAGEVNGKWLFHWPRPGQKPDAIWHKPTLPELCLT